MPRPEPKTPAPSSDRLSLRQELLRKLIHMATIAVPVLVWLLPPPIASGLLIAGAALAITAEISRRRVRAVRYLFLTRARRLLRHHERRGLAGATYMAVGYLLVYLLCPLPVAVAAMLYNSLGDATAAIVGKRWGRHRFSWGKSLEGALAGAGVNLVAGFAVPELPLLAVLLGALTAAIVELMPIPIDDNLRVTVGGGVAGWLGLLLTGA